jgi:nucleotide-binding universal stress UspA family protein
MRWLITTDGTPRAHKAAQFAAAFIRPGQDEVVLLGISDPGHESHLEESLQDLETILQGVRASRLIREGPLAEAIEATAGESSYDLALYGSRGRRGLTRLLFGSVAARLAHEIDCSLMIVREAPESVRNILICTTLDPDHRRPLELSGMLAKITGAEITILHVMSQIALVDSAPDEQLQMSAEQAIALGTREGKEFSYWLESFARAGVRSRPLIRHGLVVDEILAELEAGDYDLLVLGAHGEWVKTVWEKFLVEDMTNTILLNTNCTMLIAR